MKVWLLTNTPSPYQLELFKALHQSGRVELDVRFMRLAHRGEKTVAPERDPGFPCRELPAVGPASWRDEFRFHPSAVREAFAGDHDFYVLSGHYTSLTFLLCALGLRLRRKKWAMWLERPWPEEYRPAWAPTVSARSSFARTARRHILRTLLRAAPSVFCIGTAAIDAYRVLGADSNRLKLLPYFCDDERFRNADPAGIQAVRDRFGLAGKKVFLFSGQLIERKGADVLIDAFNRVAANRSDLALLVLGDGPMRPTLEGKAKAGVHFTGHVSQNELPAFFHAADVFVFPSRHDGWGVVLNEACAAGLPIVTTSAVGAAHDLVKNGWNGFIVPRDDVAGFSGHMLYLADHPESLAEFGKHSTEMADRFSLQRGVEMFMECVAGT